MEEQMPEEIDKQILIKCMNYNLTLDINHAILKLVNVTTEFEEETITRKECMVYLTPQEMLRYLAHIYYQICINLRRRESEESKVGEQLENNATLRNVQDHTTEEIKQNIDSQGQEEVKEQETSQRINLDPMRLMSDAAIILEFKTRVLIEKHFQKLMKRNFDELNYIFKCVGDIIFEMGLQDSQNWVNLSEIVQNKNEILMTEFELQHCDLIKELQGVKIEKRENLSQIKLLRMEIDASSMIEEMILFYETQQSQIIDEYKEIYAADLNKLTSNQIEYLTQFRQLPSYFLLDLAQNCNDQIKMNILFEILNKDDMDKLFSYQFKLLAEKALSFLQIINYELLKDNKDLIKRITNDGFIERLRGRYGELNTFLFNLRYDHIYKEITDLRQECLSEVQKILARDDLLEKLEDQMRKYSDEVDLKLKDLDEKVTQSINYFNASLNQPLHSNLTIKKVGSFYLGNLYILDDFYTLDLAIHFKGCEKPEELQKLIYPMLKMRDSYIKARGDDFSMRTYIDQRYPTLRCSDPEYETLYNIKLIFLHEQDDFMLKQQLEFKDLLFQNYNLKLAYRFISTWIKQYLYDKVIDFDMFSQYEIQNLFIAFLKQHEIFVDSLTNSLKIKQNDDLVQSPGQLLIKFFVYLLVNLKPTLENYFTTPSLDSKQSTQQDEANKHCLHFYPMKNLKTNEFLDNRRIQREYMEVRNMYNEILYTLEDIADQKQIFKTMQNVDKKPDEVNEKQ
eukprot:403370065